LYSRSLSNTEIPPPHRFLEFFDSDFTQREAKLCFQLGKMKVKDEVKNVKSFTYITFVDFMETICRIASMKNTPTEEDLQEMARRRMIQAPTMERYLFATQLVSKQVAGALIQRDSCDFGSPQTRPLHEKVAVLLSMLYVRLDVDNDGDIDAKDLAGLAETLGIP
jgi:hypothetical protein